MSKTTHRSLEEIKEKARRTVDEMVKKKKSSTTAAKTPKVSSKPKPKKKATASKSKKAKPVMKGPDVDKLRAESEAVGRTELFRELQNSLTEVSKEIGKGYSRKLAGTVSEYLEEVVRSLSDSVRSAGRFPNAPRNGKGAPAMLPIGCRFYSPPVGNNPGVAVMEEQPQIRTVLVDRTQHRVMFPYLVFVITFTGGGGQHTHYETSIGFRNSPMASLDDELLFPRLPNFAGFNVCMPISSSYFSLHELVEHVKETFWSTIFTDSFYGFQVGREYVGSWSDWEKLTKEDPLTILKGNWEAGDTVRSLVEKFSKNSDRDAQVVLKEAWASLQPISYSDEVGKAVQTAGKEILDQVMKRVALQQK